MGDCNRERQPKHGSRLYLRALRWPRAVGGPRAHRANTRCAAWKQSGVAASVLRRRTSTADLSCRVGPSPNVGAWLSTHVGGVGPIERRTALRCCRASRHAWVLRATERAQSTSFSAAPIPTRHLPATHRAPQASRRPSRPHHDRMAAEHTRRASSPRPLVPTPAPARSDATA